jgi:hypothetical protein
MERIVLDRNLLMSTTQNLRIEVVPR